MPVPTRDKVCSVCGRKYLTKKSLREHTKKHFLERVSCNICDRSYKNQSMLSVHLKRHKGQKKYVCELCNKEFIFLTHLRYHLRKVHKKDLPNTRPAAKKDSALCHVCHQCGKCFKSPQVHRAHEKFVHQMVPKKHICEVCGAMFHLSSKLNRHMIQHTGEKPFKCSTCGMCFGHKQTLRNHAICHSEDRPFQCKFCGKTFKRERNARGHEEKHHNLVISRDGVRTEHSCSLHHRRRHGSFPCGVCSKVLTSKHGLDNHLRTHTGERPYVCKMCGLALKTQSQLRTHRDTHTDTKPFSCTMCEKCFRRRPHLETHLRTHTGEKPFACDVCGRCFAQNGDMRKHRLKVHGLNDDKPAS